jgi:hypothetical protein
MDQRGKYDRDIFIEQEDVKLAATAFLRSNLKGLSVPFFANFVNKTLIPKFVPGEVADVAEKMQREYHLSLPVNSETCCLWMVRCGARYERRTQSFYTDTHESDDNRRERGLYIDRDMGSTGMPSVRELAQPQWAQMVKIKGDEFAGARASTSFASTTTSYPSRKTLRSGS